MHVLAVDIGGTHFRVGLVELDGTILIKKKHETPRQQGAAGLRPLLMRAIEDLWNDEFMREDLVAVGVGFGGPVDFERQRILRSLHAPGWVEFSFGQWLKPILSVPVIVENDGNAGAWGEYCFGAGKGRKNFVYYTISTGVGGGLVLDGKLHRGRRSAAGELGHMPLALDGPQCSCGQQGCVEALCSGLALAERAIHVLSQGQVANTSALQSKWRQNGTVTAADVFAAAKEGDLVADRLIHDLQQWFGRALVGTIHMLDPDCIAIGGGLGLSSGFVDAVANYVDDHKPLGHGPRVPIEPAHLSDDSVLLGAAALAWQEYQRSERG